MGRSRMPARSSRRNAYGAEERRSSLVPSTKAARLDTDYDALLEAQGFVARPGPRPISTRNGETVAQALRPAASRDHLSGRRIPRRGSILAAYGLLSGRGATSWAARRTIRPGPCGLPYGRHPPLATDQALRPTDFDQQAFANRAFGLFRANRSTARWSGVFRRKPPPCARLFPPRPDH